MLQNLQPRTKEQIELFEELGLMTKDGANAFYDLNGSIKGMDEIAGELKTALTGMTDQQRAFALETIFGSDAVRAGNILYKEGAEGLRNMASAMSEIKAADVAKTKLDNLLGAFEEFKGTLETVGIKIGNEFLPTFKEIVKSGTEILRMFGELDPAVVSTGLKMAGAGAGVVLLLSTIGKLVIATRGLFVSMGPTGWLILGVSALAAAFVGYNDVVKRNEEVNLDHARSLIEQERGLSKQIERFEELRGKATLTSDQLERLVDIQSEMSSTGSAEELKRLKDEFDGIVKKSGLTNEEMSEYLKLNDDLIEKVPQSTLKITDKGNALITETSAMRDLNAQQREMIKLELEAQLAKAESNQIENLAKEKKLKEEIEAIDKRIKSIGADITSHTNGILSLEQQLASEKDESQQQFLRMTINIKKEELQAYKEKLAKEYDVLLGKQKTLDATQKELAKLDEVKQELVNIELAQVGINNRKGNGIKLIEDEITRLESQRKKITEGTTAKERQNSEYQETVNKIDTQITKLQRARESVEAITGAQAGTNAKILSGVDLAKQLDYWLSKPAYKNVTVTEIKRQVSQARRAADSVGVSRHMGGTLPKFHSGGSPALSSAPSHHEIDVRLLRNEMVLTEAQQASLFRMLDAPQSSSNGSNESGINELDRLIAAIYDSGDRPITLYIDGKVAAEATYPHIAEKQQREIKRQGRGRGQK
jgi:hypothetical protein